MRRCAIPAPHFPAMIVEEQDAQLSIELRRGTARGGAMPGALEIGGTMPDQLRLEALGDVGLLLVVLPEQCDRPADDMDAGAVLGEAQPQIVVHAVEEVFTDPAAGPPPDVPG